MPDWFGSAKDVILLVLAAWGAALSTFNWWAARSRDRRKVRVKFDSQIPMDGRTGAMGSTFIRVSVVNVGHRAVKIEQIGLELPDKRTLAVAFVANLALTPNTSLPATLSDGDSAQITIPYSQVGHALMREGLKKTKLYPFAEDTAGAKYYGKAWKIDPAEASKM